MMNKKQALILCLFSSLLFWQCQTGQEKKTTDNTVAHFSVRFLESELQLRGQASFYTLDSTDNKIPLRIDNGVSFMGKNMEQKSLPNAVIRYDNTLKGSLPQPLTFNFKLEGDDSPRHIEFTMPLVGDFSVTSASKENGLRMVLSTPLMADESLLFLFTDPNGEARTSIRPGPIENLNLFIPANAFLHFIKGSYKVYLVKSKLIEETKGDVHFQTSIEYYSKEIGFEME